jgi:hypothetical protein
MDFSNLYEMLKNYKWSKVNKSLRNGTFRNNNYSINVGKVRIYQKGLPIVDGVNMKKNNCEIYNECKKLFPEHNFTGIMINKNFECPKHKDSGNEGNVIIIGLGNYTGGELVMNNKEYDIKNNYLIFEASKIEHYVKPFIGDRYSVVLFKHKNFIKKTT